MLTFLSDIIDLINPTQAILHKFYVQAWAKIDIQGIELMLYLTSKNTPSDSKTRRLLSFNNKNNLWKKMVGAKPTPTKIYFLHHPHQKQQPKNPTKTCRNHFQQPNKNMQNQSSPKKLPRNPFSTGTNGRCIKCPVAQWYSCGTLRAWYQSPYNSWFWTTLAARVFGWVVHP